jgi:hypothetical protein
MKRDLVVEADEKDKVSRKLNDEMNLYKDCYGDSG